MDAIEGHLNDSINFCKVVRNVNMNCIFRHDKNEGGILELRDDIDILMIQGRLKQREKEKRR